MTRRRHRPGAGSRPPPVLRDHDRGSVVPSSAPRADLRASACSPSPSDRPASGKPLDVLVWQRTRLTVSHRHVEVRRSIPSAAATVPAVDRGCALRYSTTRALVSPRRVDPLARRARLRVGWADACDGAFGHVQRSERWLKVLRLAHQRSKIAQATVMSRWLSERKIYHRREPNVCSPSAAQKDDRS